MLYTLFSVTIFLNPFNGIERAYKGTRLVGEFQLGSNPFNGIESSSCKQ